MNVNETKKVKYTQSSFDELQAELNERKTTRRAEIVQAIKEAKGFGDLSENAEYDAARNEQAANENRIKELEELIRNAEIIDESAIDTSLVGIGTTVTVYDMDYDEELVYTIVSKNDVDPENQKISEESPLGKSLVGHHENEEVSFEVPKGERHVKILKIEHVHTD